MTKTTKTTETTKTPEQIRRIHAHLKAGIWGAFSSRAAKIARDQLAAFEIEHADVLTEAELFNEEGDR